MRAWVPWDAMHRVGRYASLIFLALASLSTAHALAYLITFRCWGCREGVPSATHAAITGAATCALAIIVLIATILAADQAGGKRVRFSPGRLLFVQALLVVPLVILERVGSGVPTVGGPLTIIDVGLIVILAYLFTRFAKVVERVTRATLASRPRPPGSSNGCERWTPHVCDLPRTALFNATGFLRAPPLPA
jgi:hypothetical protein